MVEAYTGQVMRCDNCRVHGTPAFTLAAYPDGGDDPVFVDFCSSDCLQEWTTGDGGSFDDWEWEAEGEREPSAGTVAD